MIPVYQMTSQLAYRDQPKALTPADIIYTLIDKVENLRSGWPDYETELEALTTEAHELLRLHPYFNLEKAPEILGRVQKYECDLLQHDWDFLDSLENCDSKESKALYKRKLEDHHSHIGMFRAFKRDLNTIIRFQKKEVEKVSLHVVIVALKNWLDLVASGSQCLIGLSSTELT